MEDKDLQELFSAYNPTLISDREFMDRLQSSLDAVESLRASSAAVYSDMRRRNRIAVVCAALAGFLTGLLFTYAMPFINAILYGIGSLISGMTKSMSVEILGLQTGASGFLPVLAWLLTAGAIIFATLQTYDLTIRLHPVTSSIGEKD